MSFFSRKPNPPTPALSKHTQKAMATAQAKAQGLAGAGPLPGLQNHPVTAQNEAQQQAPSNTRFRSFCERYIVERCRDWKEGEIDERAWAAILEAKSIYNKVKEVGRTITNDN